MTIGLNISFARGFPPVSAMASVQQPPRCPWDCGLPMQPVADTDDVYLCPGCGSVAMRDVAAAVTDAVSANVPDAIAEVIGALQSMVEILVGYTQDVQLPALTPLVGFTHSLAIERNVRRSLELLRAEPMQSHGRAVHAAAIEAAARVCDTRAHSLFHDSKNGLASLEAQKCATAVRRLTERATLADRPELTAPREDNA